MQVLINAVDVLRPAAAGVEIFDPQEKPAAAGAGKGVAEHRRKGMAQMQPPGRRWGKTCDLQDSLHAKGALGDS